MWILTVLKHLHLHPGVELEVPQVLGYISQVPWHLLWLWVLQSLQGTGITVAQGLEITSLGEHLVDEICGMLWLIYESYGGVQTFK